MVHDEKPTMNSRFLIVLVLCVAASRVVGQAEAGLEKAVSLAMRGRQGAAVVLDVRSGKVLAAYDLPRAAQRVMRPGSAIKPFVLATSLITNCSESLLRCIARGSSISPVAS